MSSNISYDKREIQTSGAELDDLAVKTASLEQHFQINSDALAILSVLDSVRGELYLDVKEV